MDIITFPDELLLNIFKNMDEKDIGVLSKSCKHINLLCKDDVLWKNLYTGYVSKERLFDQHNWKENYDIIKNVFSSRRQFFMIAYVADIILENMKTLDGVFKYAKEFDRVGLYIDYHLLKVKDIFIMYPSRELHCVRLWGNNDISVGISICTLDDYYSKALHKEGYLHIIDDDLEDQDFLLLNKHQVDFIKTHGTKIMQ